MVANTNHSCGCSFEERKATLNNPYHFVDSGLPSVYLAGVKYRVCVQCGKRSADIPALKQLMAVIAQAIIENESPLTGPEIRFLRKRVGKKSSEFAKIIGVTPEQVSRWENGHNRPEVSADKLIRVFYCLLSDNRELRAKVDKHIGPWLAALPGEVQTPCIRAKLLRNTWTAAPCPA
jgi:putative zinc finger/helix-turn-helix YgiT family protein